MLTGPTFRTIYLENLKYTETFTQKDSPRNNCYINDSVHKLNL